MGITQEDLGSGPMAFHRSAIDWDGSGGRWRKADDSPAKSLSAKSRPDHIFHIIRVRYKRSYSLCIPIIVVRTDRQP